MCTPAFGYFQLILRHGQLFLIKDPLLLLNNISVQKRCLKLTGMQWCTVIDTLFSTLRRLVMCNQLSKLLTLSQSLHIWVLSSSTWPMQSSWIHREASLSVNNPICHCLSVCLCLSLSLSLSIYIYIHKLMQNKTFTIKISAQMFSCRAV